MLLHHTAQRRIKVTNRRNMLVPNQHLPTKTCSRCLREFAWRKKWERDWKGVRVLLEEVRGGLKHQDVVAGDNERSQRLFLKRIHSSFRRTVVRRFGESLSKHSSRVLRLPLAPGMSLGGIRLRMP